MAAWSQPNHMNTCLALGWTRELFPVPSERPPCSDLMAQELLDRLLVPLVPPLQVLFALVLLELGLPFSFLSPSGTRKCCHCAGRDRPLDSPETLLEFQDTRIAGSCKWTACVSVGADGVERSSAGGWGALLHRHMGAKPGELHHHLGAPGLAVGKAGPECTDECHRSCNNQQKASNQSDNCQAQVPLFFITRSLSLDNRLISLFHHIAVNCRGCNSRSSISPQRADWNLDHRGRLPEVGLWWNVL